MDSTSHEAVALSYTLSQAPLVVRAPGTEHVLEHAYAPEGEGPRQPLRGTNPLMLQDRAEVGVHATPSSHVCSTRQAAVLGSPAPNSGAPAGRSSRDGAHGAHAGQASNDLGRQELEEMLPLS